MEKVIRYCRMEPSWLREFCETPEMQRLKDVGMNCGCEYTSFPRFRNLAPYSRYRHSVGTARIVWNFTGSREQTLAALFHDISTPAFAHTIDFLHGDYLHQEYTEGRTEKMIRDSAEIMGLLEGYGVPVEAVSDYHRYPVADNDSPRLSADRLEYSLGNLQNYGLRDAETLQSYYDDIRVTIAPDGAPELAFSDAQTACRFALDALQMSKIYVADEDRYAMQRLSELVGRAVEKGVLTMQDLYGTERPLIEALCADEELGKAWRQFTALHEMVYAEAEAPAADRRVIFAKKRFIDPLIAGRGRVSEIFPAFAEELNAFLLTSQEHWVCAR